MAIARALAPNPKLLLMDEPLAALDPKRKREILPYLERLSRDLDIPMPLTGRGLAAVMEGGRAVAQGPLTETLARVDLPIKLGEDVGSVLEAVIGEVRRLAVEKMLDSEEINAPDCIRPLMVS